MSILLIILLIVLMLILLGYYYTYSGVDLISNEEAKNMIDNDEIDYIIDVRTKTEYEVGHYPGAINIPVDSINESTLPKDYKTSNFLVYCNTGQRARYAATKMRDIGVEEVYYISGMYSSIL